MGVGAPEHDAVKPDSGRVTGVRLYTRTPFTLPWFSSAVLPVARAANGNGPAVVRLRRGWLHGPHVDVVGRDAADAGIDWHGIAASWDAGPADTERALSEEKYLAQAREFGRLENVEPPYLPMREHGAVELLGPRDVGAGDPRLDSLQEVVLSTLCRPLMSMAEALVRDPSQATVRLAEAYLALADTHAMGPSYGVFSFRSHAEGFLAWASPSKNTRPAFAKRLAGDVAQLRPVVEQRLAGEPSPAAAEWRTALAYCAGVLDNAVAQGALTLEMLDGVADYDTTVMGPPGAPDAGPTGSGPDSDFHRTVDASGVIDAPSPWFAAYRLLINLFYQQLPLLTVSPLQRYYMCWAISETVDAVLGESWQDRLRTQQTRMAGTAE